MAPTPMQTPDDLLPWQGRLVRDAVLAERERCAKVADQIVSEMQDIIKSISSDESWRFAMDEMTDVVNRKFGAAIDLPATISRKIRSGE